MRRQLRGVFYHARHRAAGAVAFRHLSGFEKIRDIFRAPVSQPLLRDVRDPALAFRIGPACKSLRSNDPAEEIPRAVTLRAMAEAVDEIRAAIPRHRPRRIRRKRLAVHEQPFPDPYVAADAERKRPLVIAHLAGERRQRLQIGVNGSDILVPRALVGMTVHRRESMMASWP